METLDLSELTNFFLPPPLVRQQNFHYSSHTMLNMSDTATIHKQQHPDSAPDGWPKGRPSLLGFLPDDEKSMTRRRRPSMAYIPPDVPADEAVEEGDPNPNHAKK